MFKPIIFGISSYVISNQEKELFLKYKPWGFILFSRNISSRQQTQKLTNDLKNLFPDRFVPIFTDQEGGRVSRLRPPIAKDLYPAAKYFGDEFQRDEKNALDLVKRNYYSITNELKMLGIDSPTAPVADIYYPHPNNNVVGDRSFGADIMQIISLCRAAICGIHEAGGLSVIKHIPGHGRAKQDSHHYLPIIDKSIDILEETDFRIFKELSKDVEYAMTAHVIYNQLDPKLPVTISQDAIAYIRNEIGFKGKLISDDICMFALHDTLELSNKSLCIITEKSLNAGCDIILHCSGVLDEMKEILESI